MLLHQALDETIKYCRMSAKELAEASGVSSSRISQFRNGLFLEGKGSDLTSRAINDLIDAATYIDPRAKRVFSIFLADLDPKSIKYSSSLLDPSQLDAMDSAQISQLLIAIADRLDKPKPVAKKSTHNQKNNQRNNQHLVNALNAS
jgi:transcriptional regulator with XRE-family HTH domain